METNNENSKELGRRKLNKYIIIYFVLFVLTDIFSYLTFKEGSIGNIYGTLISLILSGGLMYSIYHGKGWARYLAIGFCILGLIVGIIGAIRLMSISALGLILLPLLIYYGYFLRFLQKDKDFLFFFESQDDY